MNLKNNYKGIIFLDIDGVLNDEQSLADATDADIQGWSQSKDDAKFVIGCSRQIIPKYVKRLNRVLTTCNLGVVLSSTWRLHDLTRKAVASAGIDDYDNRLLGITPSLGGSMFGGTRGHEIQQWLTENQFDGPFAILDDDFDFVHLEPYVFRTQWFAGYGEPGLTETIADNIIDFFQKGAKV